MSNFRTFFGSMGGVNNQPVANGTTDQWDVVLFSGTYDPITRAEHEKITSFIKDVIKDSKNADKFSKDIEIGLICNEEKTSQTAILDKFKYNLTHDEKEFITAKFFGLRMFPLSFKDLVLMANNENLYSDKVDSINAAIANLKKSFQKANILIVLNPNDFPNVSSFEEITKKFADEDLRIGFMTWNPKESTPIEFMGNDKPTGQVIKAICLMDFERPNPDQLKSFCYKYKLANILDLIRTIHFKVMGEKYLIAFRALFPDLTVYGDEEEDEKDNNYIFMMELLKKMYLRELYQNRVADRQKEAQESVSKDIGLKPVISSSTGGGAGGGAGGGSGSGATGEVTPAEGATEGGDEGAPAPDTTGGAEPVDTEGF